MKTQRISLDFLRKKEARGAWVSAWRAVRTEKDPRKFNPDLHRFGGRARDALASRKLAETMARFDELRRAS